MEEVDPIIQALIELHIGLERLGPGDLEFSKQILSKLGKLPLTPRIADIGCGTGASALFLADTFKSKVRAVDFSKDFLEALSRRAKERGLENLIETIECDMGSLDWAAESVDLLWSEGAAYNLTFKGALNAWRPFMASKGIAVISELSYFTTEVADPVRSFWQNAYPAIGTELENSKHAALAGFKVLGIHRLPSRAWWDNYYNPLKEKMAALKDSADSVMQSVIQDTEEEMSLFEQYGDQYGYSYCSNRLISSSVS
jgi:SAM-dependent methyltransferase